MNFKRKRKKQRIVSPFNCSCCTVTTAHMPSYLKMAIADRRRYQSANAQFLVDCGMFQGGREADAKNQARFAFDPRKLDFVLLTHAHIDHSGLLPRLVAAGYSGPIYATAATCDLLKVMLLDSAHIQEK